MPRKKRKLSGARRLPADPSARAGRERVEPARSRETAPFDARRFMALEPESAKEPEPGGPLGEGAIGQEADRCRPFCPRTSAASRILGTGGQRDRK